MTPLDFFFLFKQRCHGRLWELPVVMDCKALSKDLIIQERWIEFLDLPDHVVESMVPDVPKCDVDGDPTMDG